MKTIVKNILEVNKFLFINLSIVFLVLVLAENLKDSIVSNLLDFDKFLILIILSGILWLIGSKFK